MQKLVVDHNHYISYRQHKFNKPDAPTIVFLHGLMSDKNGTKALAIEQFCIKNSYNFIAFDNLGHGESSGNFINYSIDSWRLCAKKVITELKLSNIILIGSSMGGWLSLLLGLENSPLIKGILLLAPAPDFTEKIWAFMDKDKQQLALQHSTKNFLPIYEYKGIPISYKLINESKKHLLMEESRLSLSVPTIIIHGMQDEDVDYKLSLELNDKIISPYLSLKLLKYSGHRLSAPSDLETINNSINEIISLIKL